MADYDLRANLYQYAPGVVPTADIDAAMAAQYTANGNQPVTQAQAAMTCMCRGSAAFTR